MTISEQVVKAMPERIYAAKKTEGSNCVVSFDTPSLDYNVEYVRADLVPFLPVQGAVKKLKWNEYNDEQGIPDRWDAEASSFGVFYSIEIQHDGYRVVFDHEAVGAVGVFDTLEAAKAAAQADYERRILSALEPSAPDMGNPITLTYTNYRGETSERTITPIRPWYGSTEWHPAPQWLLKAYDHDKGAERDFAFKDIGNSKPSAERERALEALKAAEQFIENGFEFGFIRAPDKGDTALETLPKIKAAIHDLQSTTAEARIPVIDEGFRKGLEAACEVIDAHSEYDRRMCCDGHECGCYGATVHQSMQHYIRALSSPDHADAGKVWNDTHPSGGDRHGD